MASIVKTRITPDEVGKYLGISAQAVRERMESGVLPIGVVERTRKGQNRYVIDPKSLYEATGLCLNGYEPPAAMDYRQLAREIVSEFVRRIRDET